jgi:hypothetical protein
MAIRKTGMTLALALVLQATVLLMPALAQTSMGTFRGAIVDEQGGVLPGVTVTARHLATNTVQTTVTEARGQFYLSNLRVGAYELTAELPGFATARRADVDLRVGQELTINLTLTVSAISETVDVRATSQIVTTENTVATTVDQKMIDDLPIISRDFAQLAMLAPGATASGATGTGGGTGVSVGGARPTSNSIVVDGASNAMQFYGRQSNEFPQDWIQEFQVHTNAFGAEYGQASGGLINVVTRSGSNRYQGRVYGFFRDDALDKAPFAGRFEGDKPVFLDEAPPFSQQRFGGQLGGPLKRNEVFFFGGIQNLNQEATEVLGISQYWRNQGFETSVNTGVENLTYLFKTDWNTSANNRLTLRYTNTDKKDLGLSLGSSPLDVDERRYTFTGPLWNVMGNLATTLGNSSFNEFRVYYGRNLPWIISNMAGAGGFALLEADGKMGQNGRFATRSYPGGNFGATAFTGLEGETILSFTDNFSFVRGNHQVKFGGQLARMSMHMDVEAPHKGRWSFPTDRVFDINDPLSYPDNFSGGIGETRGEYPAWNVGFFLQDTWQVRPSVTINAGVRYDLDRTPLVLNDLIDPYNQRIISRFGGGPPLEKSRADTNNIAPRVGVVWTPTDDRRTVVRGSSGLYYNQNHFNWTVIYAIETLLSEQRFIFDANNPEQNPFWNAADPAGSRAALRRWLAESFPGFPDVSKAAQGRETILGNDPNFKIPYSLHLTGGFTREIAAGLSASVDYTFRREYDAATGMNVNYELVGGQYVIKDPRFSRISINSNGGFIRYHGMLSRVQYRRSERAQFGVSYTLAKATSNTSAGLGVSGTTNPFDLNEDLGPDDNDRRHNYVFDGSLLMPLDIQLAGVWVYRSALPYSVSTRFQLDADPFPDRPEPRNSRRGDSEKTVDVRLSKILRMGRVTGTVFWEVFNLFNSDNFLRYQGSLESPAFGRPLTQLPKQRQQLGFRVDF